MEAKSQPPALLALFLAHHYFTAFEREVFTGFHICGVNSWPPEGLLASYCDDTGRGCFTISAFGYYRLISCLITGQKDVSKPSKLSGIEMCRGELEFTSYRFALVGGGFIVYDQSGSARCA